MIRIFVGTSPGKDDRDAERVLEHSLRKNCSEQISIHFMRNNDDPENFFGGFNNDTWWTPFSFLRWTIPEYCHYEGRALYMDVDQVNFRDISELYHMDLQGKAAAIRPDGRTCVMLMDCEKMRNITPPMEAIKKNPETAHMVLSDIIKTHSVHYDPRWNCLDGEDRRSSDIYHLHFTEMTTQPWEPQWPHDTWKRKGREYQAQRHPRGDLVYIWKHLLEECNG